MKKRGLEVLFSAFILLALICINPMPVRAAAADPLVIVLDAGHGGSDSGAKYTWSGKTYTEKELNLKIAEYAKEELEQYVGVEVYMTRTSDTTVPLKDRILFAQEKKADLYVSLHNNANVRSTFCGATVYYPNYNYKKAIGEDGRKVALQVQSQLAALGLKNLGVTYRNSEDYTRYPDKKLADYYYVIKNSKLSGFPGIIVEHAYVSNSSDCRQFLNSDAQLKKLGIADATGIAEAYGLVKGTAPTLKTAENQPDGSIELAWTVSKQMNGYRVYRRKVGTKKFKLIAKVKGRKNTDYTDDTTDEGITYEYCIRAKISKQGVTRLTDESNYLTVTSQVIPDPAEVPPEGEQIPDVPQEGEQAADVPSEGGQAPDPAEAPQEGKFPSDQAPETPQEGNEYQLMGVGILGTSEEIAECTKKEPLRNFLTAFERNCQRSYPQLNTLKCRKFKLYTKLCTLSTKESLIYGRFFR